MQRAQERKRRGQFQAALERRRRLRHGAALAQAVAQGSCAGHLRVCRVSLRPKMMSWHVLASNYILKFGNISDPR